MNKNVKWPVVILSFLLTLAAIFLINNWRTSRLIDEPLVRNLLENTSIQSVEIDRNNGKTEFILQPENINDLKKTFLGIKKEINDSLGKEEIIISFVNDDEILLEFYNQVDIHLYEGVRTGNYSKINKNIEKVAIKMKIENFTLQVDEKHLYFSAEKDRSFFYKIIDLEV